MAPPTTTFSVTRHASLKNPSRHKTALRIGLICGMLHAATGPAQEPVATAFAPRSQPAGDTLFTELPPARTGIITTNAYDDPRMWRERHTEYAVGAIGTGVAIGDVDSDGRPDIYVVSKIESPRLFRNLGDWRFEDITATAGVGDDSGEWKQGAAFADVDNDGDLDLYLCRFNLPNRLFINRGDGTFTEEAAARGLDVVDASSMANFADYDRDGWIDLYLQTNILDATTGINGRPDYLFRNNGDGTFTDVSVAAGLSRELTQGHSATWWDQNEDGWPDLYVANDFAPRDFLYRNHGDGTFRNAIHRALPHTPFSAMGADFGDIDNDGHLDLFVADMAGTTYEFSQRGLTDTRAKLEDDRNENRDDAVQRLTNVLYLGTGFGQSPEVAHLVGLAGTDWTWSPRFEDLDNDGRIDLFVTNGMDREQNNLDFLERKLANVNLMSRIRLTKDSPVLRQPNLAYANRGDYHFEEVGAAWGLNKLGVSFGSALADLDGDGDLDIVFTNYQEAPSVLRNDSTAGHTAIFELRGTASNHYGLGARVEATTASGTQVRQLVSARGYLSTSEPIVHFGFGDDDTIKRLRILWPSGQEQVLANLPTNHRYTITEPASAVAGLGEAGQGSATRATDPLFMDVTTDLGLGVIQREERLEGTVDQPLLPFRFNRRGPALAIGDLSGDGVDEMMLGGTVRDGVRLLWRTGERFQILNTGTLGEPPPVNDGPLLIFDANGDGANDVLLAAGGAALPAEEPEYEPRLWLNRGNGGLDPAPPGFLPSLPISVGAAVAADFDRDGRLDLFLGGRLFPGYYPEPAMSALLLQRDGRMTDATDGFAPDLREVGLVTGALASDIDDDGWIDLVVTLEWGGVKCFRNESGRRLVDATAAFGFDSTGAGMWTAVTAADFNRDGCLDYALGNLGLNNQLHASSTEPLRLYASDFANSGTPQLVLAFYDQGRSVPIWSRAELSAKIPQIRRRFRSNDTFAASSMTDIFGAEALDQAEVYTATELRSGILLSQPDGRFHFTPLPRAAQIAPAQGMAATDFDGDGFADLLLAHNSYAPSPSIGRFDHGLGAFLRGDGQGDFTVVPMRESGWIVPGAAKAVAVTDFDLDARPDVYVTRNDDTAIAFRTAPSSTRRPFALRLTGRGGNPDAIGARVRLQEGDRVLQTAEVRAGEGWTSQSAKTLFFSLPTDLSADARLHIRWPDGSSQNIAVPADQSYLSLSQ